jgi:dipeptidyl aminopeptidase/acylaminoacyl peptidase
VYTTKLGFTRNQKAQWFHDGGGLLEGINAGGINAPYRVDLKTGEFRPIPSIPSIGMPSPDGKTLYLLRRDPKDAATAPDRIVAVDIESGRESQVSIPPVAGSTSFALSPDGRTLALMWNDLQSKQKRIARVAVDGTGYRELSSGAAGVIGNELTWSPDGRRILFNKRRDDKPMWQIVWVSADGGTPQFAGVEIDDVRLQGMELSPDGSRLAYASTKDVAELWALDNLLSVLK